MCMPRLPSEVLENIFRFLDGKSFCITREVCKTWNNVIKSMQPKKSVWRQFCMREIPRNVLEEIVWYKSTVWDDIDWINIYKKWFHSHMVLTSPYWKKRIHTVDKNPVTCVRLSGSWIITGHSNGLVCVWNLQSGDLSQSFLCHLKIINDIVLVDLLNLGNYYGPEDLPWAHHHMITISKDRYINITLLLEPMANSDSHTHLNYHTDDIKQIRLFGDIFAVRCQDNTITLWKMKIIRVPYFNLEATLLQKIIGPEDYLLSIGLWHDEVQCVSNSGKLKAITINEEEWVQERIFKNSSSESGAETITTVTAAFLFRQKTVIMLTSDGKIIMSTNENSNRHYYLMKTLRTAIVSIAFHGTILALGGENGKLFLFYMFSEEDLISLDLSQPDSTLSLSEASIISIDISYQDDSPVIVASTNDSVHVVKWFKSSTSHQKIKKRQASELFS